MVWTIFFSVPIPSSAGQQPECRCHSRNPAMKRMHEAIGFRNCGNCHARDENLMSGKPRSAAGIGDRLKNRFKEDRFCVPCHNSEGTVKRESSPASERMNISGTYYCPKDKLRLSAGSTSCPECGGKLIDINAAMEQSRTSPSNEVCIECHLIADVNAISRHQLFNADKLKKCLDCHRGHDDCGSCHH